MKFILTINNLDKHTLALLNLIKATENVFIEEEKDDFLLTDAQKSMLDERQHKDRTGDSKSFSWEDVKEKARSAK